MEKIKKQKCFTKKAEVQEADFDDSRGAPPKGYYNLEKAKKDKVLLTSLHDGRNDDNSNILMNFGNDQLADKEMMRQAFQHKEKIEKEVKSCESKSPSNSSKIDELNQQLNWINKFIARCYSKNKDILSFDDGDSLKNIQDKIAKNLRFAIDTLLIVATAGKEKGEKDAGKILDAYNHFDKAFSKGLYRRKLCYNSAEDLDWQI